MSLEAKIEALTAALQENTAALTGSAKPASKPAGKPAGKAPAKKPAAKKTTTTDDATEKFGAYLASDPDAAKVAVRAIVAHFGVKRVSEIEESDLDEALVFLGQFQEGEDPFAEDEDLM